MKMILKSSVDLHSECPGSYLGPPCSTIVTGPTRWVTPPTLTAAVSNSLIWTSACLRVLPRLQRVWAADRKLLLETYRYDKYQISQCQNRICQMILNQPWKLRIKQKNNQRKTYSLIRCSSNEGEELSQQHTVCWLVSAIFYGQRLQQGKGATAMTGRVVSPPIDEQVKGNDDLYSFLWLYSNKSFRLKQTNTFAEHV